MNYRIVVRRQAEADMAAAAIWYNQQNPGLGTEYLRSVDVCIASISRNPAMYATVYRTVKIPVASNPESRSRLML
jgi:hypothetical protein